MLKFSACDETSFLRLVNPLSMYTSIQALKSTLRHDPCVWGPSYSNFNQKLLDSLTDEKLFFQQKGNIGNCVQKKKITLSNNTSIFLSNNDKQNKYKDRLGVR